MVRIADLTAELQRTWFAQVVGVPTQFPGMSLDARGLACWYELWLSEARENVQRVPGCEDWAVLIDVHCFARDENKRRAQQLVGQAKEVLGQKLLWISEEDTTDSPTVSLRILESAVRDLTRDGTGDAGLRLQHLVISFQGRVQRTVPAAS